MKVEESVNEITIRETPGCLWIIGLFFVVIGGIFVYGALGGFNNWNEISGWQLILTFFIAVGGIAGGVYVISGAPITQVKIDRLNDSVSMTKYGFFGKRAEFYRFDEIKQFCLVEELDTENEPIWSVGMDLKNGKTIKVSAMAVHSEDIQRDYVFQINEFMRKQIPSALDTENIEH